MKNTTLVSPSDAFQIESEPGDATRYSYFVHRDGPDEFCFMPKRSTFRFPQRLNYWDVKDISEENLMELAKKENCNPHTLAECIRTVKEFKKDYEDGSSSR